MGFDVDLHSVAARCALARVVIALLDRWQLSAATQLQLLGMDPLNENLLDQYRLGHTPLPYERDILDRAGYLMGIHRGLHLLFPEDAPLRYSWVQRHNLQLGGRTPLELISETGLPGLADIARFIDDQVNA